MTPVSMTSSNREWTSSESARPFSARRAAIELGDDRADHRQRAAQRQALALQADPSQVGDGAEGDRLPPAGLPGDVVDGVLQALDGTRRGRAPELLPVFLEVEDKGGQVGRAVVAAAQVV